MKIGYGYRRTEKDLHEIGAERVWIDTSRERTECADMVKHGLRGGDTLLLLSHNDLGGSSRAHARLRKVIEAMGVEIEIIEPDKPPAKMGRPRKFETTQDQDEAIAAIWYDEAYTEAYKVRRASEIMGREIKRHQLIYRFGTMVKPKFGWKTERDS